MRPAAIAAPILLAGGAVLIVLGALSGGAHAALVVIVPVVYGSAPLFVLGVLLLVAGILALPFAVAPPEATGVASRASGTATSGGVILVGPVPIFWGSASGASRAVRVAAALTGTAVLVVAVILFVVWFR
jgi:uncharacterized membrane protein